MASRKHLLDFLFNGVENEPTVDSCVQHLVGCGYPAAFAKELMQAWDKERPDLLRGEGGRLALLVQQEAAEKLVDRLLAAAREDRGLCDKCQVQDHDVCSMVDGCPCCADARGERTT